MGWRKAVDLAQRAIVRGLGEDPTDVSYLGHGQASAVVIRAILSGPAVSEGLDLEGNLEVIDQAPTLAVKIGDLPFEITAGPVDAPHDRVTVRGQRYAVIERWLDGEGMADLTLQELE